jgi:hypothetical protein
MEGVIEMKLKNVFCLLVCFLVTYPFVSVKAETFQFEIQDSILAVSGQSSVEVPVYFNQSAGVNYFRVELEYDTTKLEYSHTYDGRFGITNAHTDFCGPGYLHVVSSAGLGNCVQPGGEPAFFVYFDVKSSVPGGTLIPLIFNDPFCYSLVAVVNGCAPSYPAYSPTYEFGSIYVQPEPEFKFTIPDSISAYPGQMDLEIPVYFDQSVGVNYFRVELEYDTTKLEYSHTSDGRFGITNAHTDFCGPGYLHVVSSAGLGNCVQPGGEPAFFVYFNVKENVPSGTLTPLVFNDPFCYPLVAVVNGCAPDYPAYSPTYDFGSVYVNHSAPVFEFSIADSISAYPGQSDLEIPVYFDQSIGAYYFRVELQYNANILEYRYVEDGRFSTNAHTDFCGPGYLHVFAFPGTGDCQSPGSEPAFYVHFKVKDNVSVGTLVPLIFNDPFCYPLVAVVNGCAPDYPAFSPTYQFGSVWIDHQGVRFTIPDNYQVYAGNTARLPVYVHNEEGLIYFRVDLAYDSTKLSYVGVEDARFHISSVNFCGDDPYHNSIFSFNSQCVPSDPHYPGGVGFYIKLKVKSGTPVGTVIPITFTDSTCNHILTLANGCEPLYPAFIPEWDNGSIKVKQRPSGCPFVFAWTGSQFEKDNTILTQSEDPYRPDLWVSDYLYLSKKPTLVGNSYLLQIREFEQEISYLDNLELILVDHPEDTKVAVSPDGEIRLYETEFVPLACVDHNGEDQLDRIMDKDGIFYICEQAGHLILTLGVQLNGDEPPSLITETGVDLPPEHKQHTKVNSSSDPPMLKIEVQKKDGTWIRLSHLPPRDKPEQAFCFVDPRYLDENGEVRIRISWTNYYSADQITYFAVSPTQPELLRSLPVLASHSKNGNASSKLKCIDGEFVVLVPGEQIELNFPSRGESALGMKRDFVLKSTGYYVPLTKAHVGSRPSTCTLLDNYPNPFNMETVISYSLSREVHVQLRIYNILGERVRTLVDAYQGPGPKRVRWDGKDDTGNEVTSGVYFYRIKAGAEVYAKKMLLLK